MQMNKTATEMFEKKVDKKPGFDQFVPKQNMFSTLWKM